MRRDADGNWRYDECFRCSLFAGPTCPQVGRIIYQHQGCPTFDPRHNTEPEQETPMSLPDRDPSGTANVAPYCCPSCCAVVFPGQGHVCDRQAFWVPHITIKPEASMLEPRDPAVAVELTPDAERITSRVEGWMREVRDRAERGQQKYPPWHTATTNRNAGGELREELLDALWYASAAEDQIAHLTAEVARLRGESSREHLARECDDLRRALVDTTARLDAERDGVKIGFHCLGRFDRSELCCETCTARDACQDYVILTREVARMRPVFDIVREWANYCNSPSKQLHYTDRLLAAIEAATQEARHD